MEIIGREIKEKGIVPNQVKVKEISRQKTTKISRETRDNQQEPPQLLILNETNITNKRKTRIIKTCLTMLLLK